MKNHKAILAIILLALSFALVSCEGGDKVVCGYIVGKRFEQHHSTIQYNHILHMTTTTLYPDMWFVWVADSTGVRKVRVLQEDYNNAHKGEFARYRTDGSTANN